MTEAITKAIHQPRQVGDFNPLKYDDSDNVEMFIRQFKGLADANARPTDHHSFTSARFLRMVLERVAGAIL